MTINIDFKIECSILINQKENKQDEFSLALNVSEAYLDSFLYPTYPIILDYHFLESLLDLIITSGSPEYSPKTTKNVVNGECSPLLTNKKDIKLI